PITLDPIVKPEKDEDKEDGVEKEIGVEEEVDEQEEDSAKVIADRESDVAEPIFERNIARTSGRRGTVKASALADEHATLRTTVDELTGEPTQKHATHVDVERHAAEMQDECEISETVGPVLDEVKDKVEEDGMEEDERGSEVEEKEECDDEENDVDEEVDEEEEDWAKGIVNRESDVGRPISERDIVRKSSRRATVKVGALADENNALRTTVNELTGESTLSAAAHEVDVELLAAEMRDELGSNDVVGTPGAEIERSGAQIMEVEEEHWNIAEVGEKEGEESAFRLEAEKAARRLQAEDDARRLEATASELAEVRKQSDAQIRTLEGRNTELEAVRDEADTKIAALSVELSTARDQPDAIAPFILEDLPRRAAMEAKLDAATQNITHLRQMIADRESKLAQAVSERDLAREWGRRVTVNSIENALTLGDEKASLYATMEGKLQAAFAQVDEIAASLEIVSGAEEEAQKALVKAQEK
ncbi:hypothetical protein BDK51DRAFT_43809, partial [Blyttiomyces helicus]